MANPSTLYPINQHKKQKPTSKSPPSARPDPHAGAGAISGSAAELVGDLLSRKPEAKEHAIKTGLARELTDSLGQRFDPEVHAQTHDRKPSFRSDGTFRKKKELPGEPEPDPEAVAVVSQQAGTSLVSLVFGLCVMTLGEEWIPSAEEQDTASEATVKWFRANNWGDLPPGAVVATVFASYAVPRLMLPRTQERVSSLLARWTGSERQKANGAVGGQRTASPSPALNQ